MPCARLFRRVVPVIALVAVGFVTSITTRAAILADRKSKKSAGVKLNTAHIRRIEILSQPIVKIDQLVGGKGGFDVRASASVGHTKRPQELVWYMRIEQLSVDAAANRLRWDAVAAYDYDGQVFVVPAAKIMTARFKEHINLRPGKYTIKIGINEILRSDTDPTQFSEKEIGMASGNVVVQ
jgi:hypothetical protein